LALETAKAGVQSAASKLQRAKKGSTQEEIAVSQTAVETARVALNNAKNNYQAVVSEQVVKVKDAYSTLLNSLPFSAIPAPANTGTTKLTVTGSYTGQTEGTYKITVDYNYSFSVSGLETWHSGAISAGIPSAFGNNGLFATFSSGSVNPNDSWTVAIPSTTSILYLKNYNAYQEALQAQSKTVSAAQGSIDTAQAQYQQSLSQLTLKQAGSRSEDIDSAEATLTIAKQKLRQSQLVYDRNILRSPMKGKVVSVKYFLGQSVPANKVFLILEPRTTRPNLFK
jgi:multidrug efflux pump subunit AcrA (membrane-fusion protein)